MRKYIALLRGINVGGNRKVSMPELKALFQENGFCDAITYINSGNIIFSSDIMDENTLKDKCEAFMKERFGFDIPTMIISVDDYAKALQHAPSWWDDDNESKHNVIFVLPPVTVEEVYGAVGAAKPEYEKVDSYGRAIFWSAPIKTFSRTRWSKIVGSSVYDSITIRNANTAKKLLLLAKQEG
jgi:uncharacterized protein (DUF1697 family)